MKIGIITLVSDNYGNKFQNYAVEQLLSEYGEVQTFKLAELYSDSLQQANLINKLSPKHLYNAIICRLMYCYDLNHTDKGVVYNFLYAKMHSKKLLKLQKKRSEHFDEFSNKNLHISKKVLNRDNTTKEWADQYDAFVCGSDQIWNPYYSTTSDLAFCSFAPEKTICISPSFGVSQIPEHRVNEYKLWLKNINSLSVREEAGQSIIKELTDRDAELLLDPTMALSFEKWISLCKEPKYHLPDKYILCYFLGKFDKKYKKQVNNFAKKHNLPVVMLFDIMSPEYYTYDPAEVLYSIKNAEYILTDSFHGTVFSILFHKNFYVFDRNEGGASMNSRLDTLLNKFNLSDRYISKKSNDIDASKWNSVSLILEKEREKTLVYINDCLRNG